MARTVNNEPSAKTSEEPDVAVVGLGPVGITLCHLLAQRGVHVLGLDRAAGIYGLPRATGLDQEVMRVFQGLGITDELAPYLSDYRSSEYRSADGKVLRRFVSLPQPYPLAWPPYMTFVQPDVERVLRESSARYPNLTLALSTELVSLRDSEAPVLEVRDLTNNTCEEVRPRFVVGCDGGNSFVRRTLGIEFEDLVFDEPWIVVDVFVEDDAVELPEVNVQYCNPQRPHTFIVAPGRLRRWEFKVLPGEDPAEVNKRDRIWQLLSPWLRPDQGRIWRSAAYNFHALVARQWRSRQVLLAGDACHMTPPFLAQGMVQGIKDVSNLAWKLGLVLDGTDDQLLDSYEAERRPLVRDVIAVTKDLGNLICELDPERARQRNDRMLAMMEAGQGTSVRQELFPPIRHGIIGFLPDGTPSGGAGRPCPQPWVLNSTGRHRLDDILPSEFNLLIRDGFELSEDAVDAAASLALGVMTIAPNDVLAADVREEATVFSDWLRVHDANAILVRPDHIVFGTAADCKALIALLSQLRSLLHGEYQVRHSLLS